MKNLFSFLSHVIASETFPFYKVFFLFFNLEQNLFEDIMNTIGPRFFEGSFDKLWRETERSTNFIH